MPQSPRQWCLEAETGLVQDRSRSILTRKVLPSILRRRLWNPQGKSPSWLSSPKRKMLMLMSTRRIKMMTDPVVHAQEMVLHPEPVHRRHSVSSSSSCHYYLLCILDTLFVNTSHHKAFPKRSFLRLNMLFYDHEAKYHEMVVFRFHHYITCNSNGTRSLAYKERYNRTRPFFILLATCYRSLNLSARTIRSINSLRTT